MFHFYFARRARSRARTKTWAFGAQNRGFESHRARFLLYGQTVYFFANGTRWERWQWKVTDNERDERTPRAQRATLALENETRKTIDVEELGNRASGSLSIAVES